MKLKIRIVRNVIIAVLIVAGINFAVLYYLGFPAMALIQIKKYLPLITLLVAGFAIQIGLFTYIRHVNTACSITSMAGGGISSISMILCCSHYLVNIVPFISVSFALSLTKYTFQILIIGLLSNVIGIYIMYGKLKKMKGGNIRI